MPDDNDGHEIMDSMEQRLALIGMGETAYCILVGAQAAGADSDDALTVTTAWFLAGLEYADQHEQEEEEEDDETA